MIETNQLLQEVYCGMKRRHHEYDMSETHRLDQAMVKLLKGTERRTARAEKRQKRDSGPTIDIMQTMEQLEKANASYNKPQIFNNNFFKKLRLLKET